MLDHSPDMTGDQFEAIAAIARQQLVGAVPDWRQPRYSAMNSGISRDVFVW
jgi:hypothetical protein